ncbi:MAG: tripartite tricarboxylate transporter substrate binding protein, partial [Methylibium sp.]
MIRRIFVRALTATLALAAGGAPAQAWPTQTIRIVVPYSPGGSADIIARAISGPLSEALKQTV